MCASLSDQDARRGYLGIVVAEGVMLKEISLMIAII